jgi:hypothetical protein
MNRYSIVLIVLLLFSKSVLGQENDVTYKVLFRGLVYDASTLKPIPDTQIMIKNSLTSVSGDDGTFSIYLFKEDTVVFKTLGYKPTVYSLSDTLSGNEFVAGIYLTNDTISIPDVVIVPRYRNLKSEILNSPGKDPSVYNNARYNVAVSAYQGRNSISTLSSPEDNYRALSNKQKIDASEKGGIPSDKIVGLNPLLLVPAGYLLIKGLPEKPPAFKSQVTDDEIEMINKKYFETIYHKK